MGHMTKTPRISAFRVCRAALVGALILSFSEFSFALELEWNDAMNAASKALAESRYAEAERWLRTAVKEAEKFGPEDRRLGMTLSSLGAVVGYRGAYVEAEQRYQRSLAITEKAVGPGHVRVADGLTGLAQMFQMQGKVTEAQQLLERALAIREKVLGPEHPDVADGLNNLGALYKSQGNYEKAELY